MQTIHLCPLCGEVADYSDDYGWSLACEHPPYEGIEPVEVHGEIKDGRLVFDLPDAEEWKATVGAEMLERQMGSLVSRINWMALTCDGRVAAIRRRREEGGLFADEWHRVMLEQMISMRRMVLGPSRTEPVPCPRCHELFCENATTREVPGIDVTGGFSVGKSFSVPLKGETGS